MSNIFEATGAQFIGSPNFPLSEMGDPAIVFRREFTVGDLPHGTRPVSQALLHVTALGVLETYLNGIRTDDHVLEPSWTTYRHRLTYRTHDVTDLIKPGANVFGAVVGEGWATGRLAAYENYRRVYADRVALLAVLELRYDDGAVEYVVTNPEFRTGTAEVQFNGIYDGTTIDFTAAQPGWDKPGFDDAAWPRAEVVDWETDLIEPATAEPIREIGTLPAVKVWWGENKKSVYVDFGQNISGWVRLHHRAKKGEKITIRHAELLVDGKPDYETIREAKATDTYILADDGETVLVPRLTFHGFRYAEITGLTELPNVADIQAVVINSDMPRTGWFTSSNENLNKLHENTLWGMRDNFVGLPTDCPQRDERLGWTGDINAFSPAAVLLYDVQKVLGSWLKDLLLEHQARGKVSHYVPSLYLEKAAPDWIGAQSPPSALWSDTAVRLPWKLYQQYGDEAILSQQYWSMKAFVDQVEPLLDKFGLWTTGWQYGDWLDPDAPPSRPGFGKTDRYMVANAFFTKVCAELAGAAEVLGHADDAARYGDLAARMRENFRTAYMNAPGKLTMETTAGYAIAIEMGLFDEDELAMAGQRLVELVRAKNHRIDTGFAGTPYVAPALTRTGYLDDAYQLVLQPEIPGFMYPISMGATTIWERWDSVLPDGRINSTGMTSLNHYAYGAIAAWLYHTVGGLEATSPGWATIRVAPQPGGGLSHAEVKHLTPLGLASVAWALTEGGEMSLNVTVPDGATAEVRMPLHPTGRVEIVTGGQYHWTYPAVERPGEP